MKQTIEKIIADITDEVVITSCGYISREVYRAKDRDRNFYMLGSMGCALAVGLGLAHSRGDLQVVVISGDGATLMSLGTIALFHHLNLSNIKHYVLDNNCYASTGGQSTCSEHLLGYFTEVIKVGKKSNAPRIPLTCKQIKERFQNAIQKKNMEKNSKS